MNDLYGDQHLSLQDQFATRGLAERVRQIIVQPELDDMHKGFIETRDMLFLTTVDHRGYPTCSYKGGVPGFVKVLDSKTLVFPSYNGNGMFLSMGNISVNAKVGLLFIDFTTPHRIRVHGVASIDHNDPLLAEYHEAELVVRVTVTEVFVNCPRYIHQYQRVATSKYAPQPECPTPSPQWKRIDAIQDVLPEADLHQVAGCGGTITPEEYGMLVMKGEG
ncbi:pyridoxamine 5'-phosphate oxidase family protein [Methylovulum psychrotolerans]|uniref:pyridoxamine 5'-phosphate oxidase family protein n=1 Tax=Methylovulum psychrotolerans TaxID=1704499 RepID=UPI001BFF2DB5|nr:pyridoxamine 5'-phosphate oxidase family protein [Methylovulum psychrotolerans]MBT9096872.1 pyridoxamine 5'-phosphate oxidase family protein [Methylovulum psychrotolerans]